MKKFPSVKISAAAIFFSFSMSPLLAYAPKPGGSSSTSHTSSGGGSAAAHGGGGGGGGGGGFHGGGGGGGGGSTGGGGGGSGHSSSVSSSTAHSVSGSISSSGRTGSTSPQLSSSAISASGAGNSNVHVGTGHLNSSVLQSGTGSRTPTFSSAEANKFHAVGGGGALHTDAAHFRTGSTIPMHTAATFHGGYVPSSHMNPGYRDAVFAHSPAMHVTHLGVTHFGSYPLHLAGAGYHPAYFHHSFYHGPWSGHGWGWGWSLSPAYGWGFGWGPGGFSAGLGWGYGGYSPYSYWGPYGYWGRPLGWGFGAWGLGCGVYSCGYYPYYNPYYVVAPGNPIVYNYSSPIPIDVTASVPASADPNEDSPVPEIDNPDFDDARAAFRAGDYPAALASVDRAIARRKTDGVLHEFRSLTLFALQDYRQSAGVVHSVLAVGPGWDWTTMSSLYGDPNAYAQQLRALEDYTLANPRAADAHFLLGYHYMVCNHKDASANQLQIVTKLQPDDRLAGELLRMVQGPPQQPATPPDADPAAAVTPNPPADAAPEAPPIDPKLLPGKWSASRPDGSKFSLTLTDDGNFTWKFSVPKQKGDEFSGTYKTDGPVLILERAGGAGAMAGVATFSGEDGFNFKMVGGPPEDKGLDFSR